MNATHAVAAAALAWLALVPHGACRAAQPAPFAEGDAAAGKVLVERDCVACHARKMDGAPERMYLRPDRRVKTPAQLIAQVRYCNTELGSNYFPDDEANVAAHLNGAYYHFAP